MPSFTGLEMSDDELISDILSQKPEPDDHLGSTVIVDGCPIVGPTKFELLEKFLIDKFSKIGPIASHHFPVDEDTKETKGYIFVTYEDGKTASQAVRVMNNTALDKNHTFQVTLLADYERAINVPTEWKPPPQQEYKDFGNLKSWLLNELCRDQFAVVHGDGAVSTVYWHSTAEPILIEERDRWTYGFMRWSPRGTYLATMHQQGVVLWGGEKFVRIGRFPHSNVTMIDFSPMEQFMVSVSLSRNYSAANSDRPMADVTIWDVRRCLSRREFTLSSESHPIFKWSPRDEYFASLQDGVISIYSTSNFRLLDKKKLGQNIRDFAWSPTDNILAFWLPESDNSPAKVVLMDIPSREEVCAKNLFSVAKISLNWHERGDFLAVQVLRCAKKKIDGEKQVKYVGTYMNFEIVRMREKLYPVDQIEVKASVSCFQWEPNGTRFAFLQSQNSGKLSVCIYDVPRGASVREVANIDLTSPRSNELQWSPKGNLLVVGELRGAEGNLEFISADEGQTWAKGQHALFNELHWDPTGRYVATVVSTFYHNKDNAVWFWNSVGRCLYKMPLKGLQSFTWRPRPPSLLSAEQLQTIKKNMAKYNAQFANEDRMLASRASRELLEKRQKLLSEFNSWKANLLKHYSSEKEERLRLRGGVDTDHLSSDGLIEEELEFLVSSTKEVVKRNEDD